MADTSFFADEFITHIHITNGQIKSLEKAKIIAEALEVIEEEMGIGTTKLTFDDCFFCSDVNRKLLEKSPMEENMRDIILECQRQQHE